MPPLLRPGASRLLVDGELLTDGVTGEIPDEHISPFYLSVVGLGVLEVCSIRRGTCCLGRWLLRRAFWEIEK